MDADTMASCTSALVDVAEDSFFAFVVPTDDDAFLAAVERLAREGSGRWMSASVTFSGPSSGSVSIEMPVELAESLRASFLGLGPDDDVSTPPLADSVGEFVNQVCGMWLTTTCQDRRFDLSPPSVRAEPTGWRPSAQAAGRVGTYEVNDWPMRLAVVVSTEG